MLLVSEQDFNEFQKASISEFFQGFLNELDSVPYSEIELDKPREYVFYLIKKLKQNDLFFNKIRV